MKLKIVLVGAGSREFGPATIRDILLSNHLNRKDLEVVLMDISEKELPHHYDYAKEVAEKLGRNPKLSYTTDLEAALEGADYVITAIEIKRYFYWSQDFHIPRKHGFNQIYGENGGPGGLFHALRNFEPSMKIARAMEKVCPDAWLLNYTNPLTKLCEVLTKLSKIKVIGLCHGVFHGKKQLCKFLDIDYKDLDAKASGLNHFTWFQSIENKKTGEDLYPTLKEKEKEAHWLADWDEIALSRILMRVFGLYPSPGANHIGEYIRWASEYLGSSSIQFFYDPNDRDPWKDGDVPTWVYNLQGHPTNVPLYPGKDIATIFPDHQENEDHYARSEEIKHSGELAIPIIEGMNCEVEQELAAVNIPNQGYVPGLPDGAVVEVPALVNGHGLHPIQMEKLPEAVLALLRTQTSINQLLVEAYEEKSKNKLLQAVLLDPTCHSYKSAVHMIDEMLELQREVLPFLISVVDWKFQFLKLKLSTAISNIQYPISNIRWNHQSSMSV